MTSSMWPALQNLPPLRTPHALLLEQAELLKEISNGLLLGEVRRAQFQSNSPTVLHTLETSDAPLVSTLFVVAPSLANYRYEVLDSVYSVQLYPVLVSTPSTQYTRCDDESAFLKAVKEILSSPKTERVLRGLMAQISTDAKP